MHSLLVIFVCAFLIAAFANWAIVESITNLYYDLTHLAVKADDMSVEGGVK